LVKSPTPNTKTKKNKQPPNKKPTPSPADHDSTEAGDAPQATKVVNVFADD